MASAVTWVKIKGVIGKGLTQAAEFFVGYDGPKLIQDSTDPGKLLVQNNSGVTSLGQIETGYVDANTKVQSPLIEVENSTDKTVIQRASGGTASVDFVLPNAYGTNGQVLSDNGAGTLSWIDQQSIGGYIVSSGKADITNSSSSSTGSPPFTTLIDLDTPGTRAFLERIIINVQTAFTTTGTAAEITLGTTSDPDKFALSADIDLTTVGSYIVDVGEYVDGDTGSDNIGYDWQKNNADAGAMTVIAYYSQPAEDAAAESLTTSLTATFTYSDVISGSKFLGNCPVNKIVSDADIIINSIFDNNTTITVGDASAQARLMEIADNFPDTAKTYETEPNYQYATLTGLYLYFTGTPTQGDGKAIIHLS